MKRCMKSFNQATMSGQILIMISRFTLMTFWCQADHVSGYLPAFQRRICLYCFQNREFLLDVRFDSAFFRR